MSKQKQIRRRMTDGRPLNQVAALAYRVTPGGQIEVLVMTSRETQRVVIPKGWPMKNRKDWKSAEIEARQEAGVVGDVGRKRLGQYLYWKRLDTHFALVKVSVYPLAVRRQLADWPERHERMQAWLPAEDAALLIDEPELGAILLEFAQSRAAHLLAAPKKQTSPRAPRSAMASAAGPAAV
ncbi:NUDIX hydrolase [Ancylobacter sp. IITR112]|uniref:NUDIX hydrolase n=1 Tax=Ancylobacter sp. IITR112 TaxID=3138073 RepID=UPI003529FD90